MKPSEYFSKSKILPKLSNYPIKEISKRLVKENILKFGDQSNSYFHLQDDVRYFYDPSKGILTFSPVSLPWGKANLVFLKPLCNRNDIIPLIREFEKEHGTKNIYVGMDETAAKFLEAEGFRVNEIGEEFTIPIQNFKISGRSMRYLRSVKNYGNRGIVVKEQSWDEVDQDQVYEISKQWMKNKKVKTQELRLLTAPPNFRKAWKERKFFCYKDGKLVGFVFFTPVFENGEIIGQCANILRSTPFIKPQGILDFVVLTAMEKFKKEGLRVLALGLAPLHNIEKRDNDNTILRYLLGFLYEKCNFLYSFKPLAFHKSRYKAHTKKVFVCNKEVSTFNSLLFGLKGTGVIKGWN
tara:strand:- start:2382 stop:3437 length:1056 start_codon:yes stop_codon:yes gene_type:complete